MASVVLSRRVEKIVGYPPLSELGEIQRREFHEALLHADRFEDLSGKWQAAILEAEQNRPKLRLESISARSGPRRPTLVRLYAPRLKESRCEAL